MGWWSCCLCGGGSDGSGSHLVGGDGGGRSRCAVQVGDGSSRSGSSA